MEVRDPVHGSIQIDDCEVPILEGPFFQRLRNIKQLGFSEYIFPGATHTRYLHSIGVMDIGGRIFDKLFENSIKDANYKRLRETLRLSCLLHDIGHAPLSHTTEIVMPQVSKLQLPSVYNPRSDRQASHEDYTIKAITDSELTESFKAVQDAYGVNPDCVADVILGINHHPDYFLFDGLDIFPVMHQLVSSEMDADRMDYLLRDSYFCGVSYGKFDLDWIIDNLHLATFEGPTHKQAFLALSERAVATFDDFLLSRFHMFLMVYFHYKAVCLEKILARFFKTSDEYKIPASINEYLNHDDHFLMKVLRNSKNPWAKKVITNSIPKKIFETFGLSEMDKLETLEDFLDTNDIDYIKCSSAGRLSKYYQHDDPQDYQYSLKVVRSHGIDGTHQSYRDIHQATDLFDKFSRSHIVNRIHCEYEDLPSKTQKEIRKIIGD